MAHQVAEHILSNQSKLAMYTWHSNDDWHNGQVNDIRTCNTTHCMAGWAHVFAAMERPALLGPKINIHLVGKLTLGEEAESHFFDNNETAIDWLRTVIER